MALWVVHSVRLVGASPVILGGLTQVGLPQGADIAADIFSGGPWPQIVYTRSKRPTVTFTSKNIAQVLGLTGASSLAIKTGGTYTALEVVIAQLDDCGRIAAGSVHRKIAFNLGCLYPRTLSVSSGQDAEITAEFIALSADGATSPIAISGTQALPTLPAIDVFAMHALNLTGAISVGQKTQLSVDFGISANSLQLEDGVFPQLISVDELTPRCNFTSHDLAKFDAAQIPDGGLIVAHASNEIWFRKRKQDADVLHPLTASQHLKLTMAGLTHVEEISGSGNTPAALTGVITGRYDGTNNPVTVAVNQAISA
jgi:hypothetical protein